MNETRTRFAPSPTGFLHVGHLRSCLYAYAFAKSHGGKFLLRIEDTDRKRYVPGSVEKIYEILKLFGFNWDEGPMVGGPYGPYIQSERVATGIYQKYADKLVAEGHAYYCFCPPQTKEEITQEHSRGIIKSRDLCRNLSDNEIKQKLDSGQKPAIRLRVPDNETVSFTDFVMKKEITWETNSVDEVMLLKSDGFPTYHLAAMVDDFEMKISHVIRGRDWLPSAPAHLLVIKYLGFPRPEIGHLTDILDPKGGKLSKRKGSVSCEEYLTEGYLPEALLNFVMLLGWAPKDNRELFTLDEFVQNFQKGDLQIANPIFNRVKLDWFNGVYLRKKTDQELVSLIKPFLKTEIDNDSLIKIVPLIKDRLVKLTDFEVLAAPILNTCSTIDPACLSSVKKEHLEGAIKVISEVSDWKLESINEKLMALIKENGWKTGDFYMSLRVAICGCKVTPPINESVVILGKEKTLAQLNQALTLI